MINKIEIFANPIVYIFSLPILTDYNCRLQFKLDVRVVFLGLMSSAVEGQQRPVTATRTGKVSFWDIKIKQKKKLQTKLVTEVNLRAERRWVVVSLPSAVSGPSPASDNHTGSGPAGSDW